MDNIREIDWYNNSVTVLNPIALILTLAMCVVILFAKKQYIIMAFIIIACLITSRQRIVIGIGFTMLRFLVIFGLFRFFILREEKGIKINTMDKMMILWVVCRTICHILLWRTVSDTIEVLGYLFDILGMYFVVRFSLNELTDYGSVVKWIAIISVAVAFFMTIEQITDRNLFYIFGGVSEFTWIRDGKIRSQGAFSHAIMAGSFGASIVPMMWGLWKRKRRFYIILGTISGIVITYTASSSGALLALMAGFLGIFMFKYKRKIKTIKWLIIILLVILHLSMTMPVWYLITYMDVTGSSTSYYRYALIDAAIRHFSEWFLVGIKSTAQWGWGLQDLTNQFIFEGAYGGIISVIFFIICLRLAFKTVGYYTNVVEGDKDLQKYIWSFGVVLFTHTVSFIGVSYFGQMEFFLYLILAMISGLNDVPSLNYHNASKSELIAETKD